MNFRPNSFVQLQSWSHTLINTVHLGFHVTAVTLDTECRKLPVPLHCSAESQHPYAGMRAGRNAIASYRARKPCQTRTSNLTSQLCQPGPCAKQTGGHINLYWRLRRLLTHIRCFGERHNRPATLRLGTLLEFPAFVGATGDPST